MDFDAILRLNEAHAAQTSSVSAEAMRAILRDAFHVGLRGEGREALLIAFDQDAPYESPNFRWFRARLPRFVYVDRIIVAPAARRRGLARALYTELFAAAARAGHSLVTCEVNVDPPNPASDALHELLGFAEMGRAAILGGSKTVRYLARPIAAVPS